jgi:glycosyltransferase involved in cell wall biosynthesis
MRILVIIPAFNEQEALPGTLNELREVRPDLDVVVVSDGSTDRTSEVARAAGVTVLDLPYNLGVGGALRTGFMYAVREDYDAVLQFDADGQHDPGHIKTLTQALDDGADLVIGTRFGDASDDYDVGRVRRVAMRSLQGIVRRLTGKVYTDTSSGFRVFSKRAVLFFSRNYPTEYLETVESLILATLEGFDVIEVAVDMRQRAGGVPSARGLKLGYHYVRLLLVLSSGARRTRPSVRIEES